MESATTTLLAAAGISASVFAEYASVVPSGAPDFRTECLCWLGLLLILRFYRQNNSTNTNPADDEDSTAANLATPTWMLWAASLSIVFARILPLWENVRWISPLATTATLLFCLQKPQNSSALPRPVSALKQALGSLDIELDFSKHSASWAKLSAAVIIGIASSHVLLVAGGHAGRAYLAAVVFLVAQSASFILLSACKSYHGDGAEQQRADLKTAENIALKVFCMIAGVTVFNFDTSLSWSLLVQPLLSSVKVAFIFLLIFRDCTVSSTTFDTYSFALSNSLAAVSHPVSLSLIFVCSGAIAQAILGLPRSATGRKLLSVFAILPILATLNQTYYGPAVIQPPVVGLRVESKPTLDPSIHPIQQLVAEGNARLNTLLGRQSKTLENACAEYKRRYKRPPPPGFDKWFNSARSQGFLMVDEFDTMMEPFEPFWGVPAADLRGRVESALKNGHESMIRFVIDNHRLDYSMEREAEWTAEELTSWVTTEMLKTLPDLVFAVNVKDEPRVTVPHDMLEAAQNIAQKGGHLKPAKDSDLSQRVDFLNVGKQNIWDSMTLACPPDSPARNFYNPSTPPPYPTLSDVGFLTNVTLSKEVCLYPELRHLHGSLSALDTMMMTHSLVPIFSPAKLSSLQDLLLPGTWYSSKMTIHDYDESEDMDWDKKNDLLYWVGSTTGSHGNSENWRESHRQRMAAMTTDEQKPITLMRKEPKEPVAESGHNGNATYLWNTYNSTMSEVSSLMHVKIASVIQCEEDACNEQKATFIHGEDAKEPRGANYKARYLLDLDGNSFSGRFYRSLQSKSAVLKQTIFKEWHDDWLVPWVHYIPVSLEGTELPELVRYLVHEPEGQELGKKMAKESTEWANKVFRKQDFGIALWRLLLEYGRLMDDNRDQLQCCDL